MAVKPRRWPRSNDAESIRARQDALRSAVGDEVLDHDLTPYAGASESLTGAMLVPVAVVGPLELELGEYELEEPDGTLRETGRAAEQVYVPLAHTEGGLSASLQRGARAAAEAGGFRTYVLHDRITRASAFTCRIDRRRHRARALDRGRPCRRCGSGSQSRTVPFLSRHARLREVDTHVVGTMCHVLWAWTTGDAVGPNMMTRNSLRAEHGLRHGACARAAATRDPRGEHGRGQEALASATSSSAATARR